MSDFKIQKSNNHFSILFLGFALCLLFFWSKPISAQPIMFTLYTLSNNTLKLTAQLDSMSSSDPKTADLEIQSGESWSKIATESIVNPGWTVPFKIENWTHKTDVSYRVVYKGTNYTGTIRKDPVNKGSIIVAAFTGNDHIELSGGDRDKNDIVEAVKKVSPDLLFFSGDQTYNQSNHFAGWLEFGREFGDLLRDIPTVVLPDDHDVGQGNIWGAGGMDNPGSTCVNKAGGYCKSVEYVNAVQRAQTSHMPDPFDPTPVDRGITVFYTSMVIGGVGFAILEDRKWKNSPDQNLSDPELLGQRQIDFINQWTQDWKNHEMKGVLSATTFAAIRTNASRDNPDVGNTTTANPSNPVEDKDSNGWPAKKRDIAISALRKGFPFMLHGDTHLANIIQHGLDEWNSGPWSFTVPSIANHWERHWVPKDPGANHVDGLPNYTGEYSDAFGNKLTMWAVANPNVYSGGTATFTERAAGFGVVKFNKTERTITMECWPRETDPLSGDDKQYKGWPKTVTQESNFGKKAVAYLPTLNVTGGTKPVVQIINEANNEIVYTLRIKGSTFCPKVFAQGNYTIKVGEEGVTSVKTFNNVQSISECGASTLEVPLAISDEGVKPSIASGSLNGLKVKWDKSTRSVKIKLPVKGESLIDILRLDGKNMAISRRVQGPGEFRLSIPGVKSGKYLVRVKSPKGSKSKEISVIH